MSEQPEYIETWKSIAAFLKRSERWCRYMARRGRRPLPVFHYGGIIRMNLEAYRGWLEEEQAQPLGCMGVSYTRAGATPDPSPGARRCSACREPGHRAPQCPRRLSAEAP